MVDGSVYKCISEVIRFALHLRLIRIWIKSGKNVFFFSFSRTILWYRIYDRLFKKVKSNTMFDQHCLKCNREQNGLLRQKIHDSQHSHSYPNRTFMMRIFYHHHKCTSWILRRYVLVSSSIGTAIKYRVEVSVN